MNRGPCLLAAVGLFAGAPAEAAQPLDGPTLVLRFQPTGVNPTLAEVFQRLLEAEIGARYALVSPAPDESCGEPGCATRLGASVGASQALYGSLLQLGGRIVVTVGIVEVKSQTVLASDRLTASSEEELEIVAERIIRAFVRDEPIKEGAQLGSITEKEAQVDRRRVGRSGVGLRLNGVFPIDEGYGDVDAGLGIDLSYWYEAPMFSIEPRVGVRWSADPSNDNLFVEVPIDIGVNYILSLGDFAPYAGAGLGARYFWDRRVRTLGGTIQAEQITTDDAWAFGGYARIGILLFRTYTLPVDVSVSYNLALTTLNGVSNPQAVSLGIGVIF